LYAEVNCQVAVSSTGIYACRIAYLSTLGKFTRKRYRLYVILSKTAPYNIEQFLVL